MDGKRFASQKLYGPRLRNDCNIYNLYLLQLCNNNCRSSALHIVIGKGIGGHASHAVGNADTMPSLLSEVCRLAFLLAIASITACSGGSDRPTRTLTTSIADGVNLDVPARVRFEGAAAQPTIAALTVRPRAETSPDHRSPVPPSYRRRSGPSRPRHHPCAGPLPAHHTT